jgi:hypothetical protein
LRQKITLVLLVSVLCSTAASAQLFPRIEPPPLVRFTGALLPIEEEGHRGLHALIVLINEKRWIFRLKKVETLTGRNRGWSILQDLFPPQVRFTGPANLIQLLQKPESEGKLLVIEGRLYTGDRRLFVTAVEEAAEEPKRTKPAGIL